MPAMTPPRWPTVIAVAAATWLLAVLAAPLTVVSAGDVAAAIGERALQSAALRTVWTSLLSAAIAMAVAVPTAYAISRGRRLRTWLDPLIDVPLAAPPLVIGVCLLLLFRGPLQPLDNAVGVSLSLHQRHDVEDLACQLAMVRQRGQQHTVFLHGDGHASLGDPGVPRFGGRICGPALREQMGQQVAPLDQQKRHRWPALKTHDPRELLRDELADHLRHRHK